MGHFARHLFTILVGLGGFGLLGMGILDSSFLFMPLGNDLLMVAMTARKHNMLFYYAAMASAGSVIGCLIMDIVARRGGEAALEKQLSPRRLEYVKCKVNKRGGWAIALGCLMPPPFPFTAIIMASAALQYSRRRMLALVGAMRMVRFSIIGALAVLFGRRILGLAKRPEVEYGMVFLLVIFVVGSVWSVVRWIRRSGKEEARPSPAR